MATVIARPSMAGRRAGRFVKQVGTIVATLFGLLLLTFVIGRLLPSDPVIALLGDDYDPAAYQRLTVELGLDKPMAVQFAIYVKNVLSGDLGVSVITGRPVTSDIARVFPATIELATVAIVIAVILGVTLGVVAAVNRNKPIDHVTRVITLLGFSAPGFWISLMALVVFYAHLGWLPGSDRQDIAWLDMVPRRTGLLLLDSALAGDWEAFRDAFAHLIMPAMVLAYHSMAYIARMTRSFMLEQLSQEYVLAARAKGLSRQGVIWLHAFRNIRVQLLTIVALTYGGLVDGAVLIETVFAWPGFGQYFVNALVFGDMNAVLGCTLLIGVIFIGFNLLCDLLYQVFDPRTR